MTSQERQALMIREYKDWLSRSAKDNTLEHMSAFLAGFVAGHSLGSEEALAKVLERLTPSSRT